MAIPSEIAKEITLDLTNVTNPEEAKRDVGEFVVNEILRTVSRGKSPVEGQSFAKLNPTYADEKKGGNRTPNLELEGDLLDALEFDVTASGVKVGIFKSSEVPKADGHNNFSGQSSLPTRRFIPTASEDFKGGIKKGIERILNRYKRDEEFDPFEALAMGSTLLQADTITDITDIDIDDILNPFRSDFE